MGNPVELTGSCYELTAWINWARTLGQTDHNAADYGINAWHVSDGHLLRKSDSSGLRQCLKP